MEILQIVVLFSTDLHGHRTHQLITCRVAPLQCEQSVISTSEGRPVRSLSRQHREIFGTQDFTDMIYVASGAGNIELSATLIEEAATRLESRQGATALHLDVHEHAIR